MVHGYWVVYHSWLEWGNRWEQHSMDFKIWNQWSDLSCDFHSIFYVTLMWLLLWFPRKKEVIILGISMTFFLPERWDYFWDFHDPFPARKMWLLLRFPWPFSCQNDGITFEISMTLFLPERCDFFWDFHDPFPARKMWLLFPCHSPWQKDVISHGIFLTLFLPERCDYASDFHDPLPGRKIWLLLGYPWPFSCQKDVITLETSMTLSLPERYDNSVLYSILERYDCYQQSGISPRLITILNKIFRAVLETIQTYGHTFTGPILYPKPPM